MPPSKECLDRAKAPLARPRAPPPPQRNRGSRAGSRTRATLRHPRASSARCANHSTQLSRDRVRVELPPSPAGARPPARSARMLSAARERAAVSETLATFIFVSRSRHQPRCAAAQAAPRASPSATSLRTARCAGGSAGPCTSCGASRSCSPSPRTRSPSSSLSSARASPRPRRSPPAPPAPHRASTRISGRFRPRTRLHPPARARQRGPSRTPLSRWRCPHAPPARVLG
jgi:hypothetical protein